MSPYHYDIGDYVIVHQGWEKPLFPNEMKIVNRRINPMSKQIEYLLTGGHYTDIVMEQGDLKRAQAEPHILGNGDLME